jgi:3-oxoacyl-[acyl-carrier protein] reductase
MDLLLKNKKVLVTGASRGIGLACAKSLALEGADLIISSRSKKNLEEAIGQIQPAAGKLYVYPADLSEISDIKLLNDFVIEKFGYLDCMLLNTGGPSMGSALGHPDETWLSAVNSLLMSVVRLTRYFIPIMQERGFGRIISISSTGVKQPIAGLVLSNSIRSSVVAYLKTLSSEVAKDNILINSLLPGSTNTERLTSLHETIAKNTGKDISQVISDRIKSIPVGKFADPGNLAVLATFLLSPKNEYITGQSIAVDGGMVSSPF